MIDLFQHCFEIINQQTLTNRFIIIMSYRTTYGYSGSLPFASEDNLSFFKGYHKGKGVSVLICQFELVATNGDDLAIKRQEMLNLEVTLQKISRISHRNVAKIYEVIRTQDHLVVVQQDCARGTLMKMLINEKFIQEKLALYITRQVAQGLQQLHKYGIVHGYINLENIELDLSGNWKISIVSLILKIFYLPPEFKLSNVRAKEGDIFSLGTALYKMMFGKFPYTGKSNQEILANIKNGKRRTESILDPKIPFKIVVSKHIENLAFKMMQFKPQVRPGLDFIIAEINEYIKDDISKNRKVPPQFTKSYILFAFNDRPSQANYANQQLLTALDKQSGELRKVKIVEFNPDEGKQFEQYYRQRLTKFILPSQTRISGLIQIKEIIEARSTVVIVYQYFNQNTLEEYLEKVQELKKGDSIDENKSEQIIQGISQTLINLPQPHTWVSAPRIYIKNGKAKIAEPVFETEQVRRRLFASRDQIDEINPQKKKSRNPIAPQPNMDTWSVGVLFYKLIYNTEPSFNADRALILPNNHNIKQSNTQKLTQYLTQNPKERRSLSDLDPSRFASVSETADVRGRVSSIAKTELRRRTSSITKKQARALQTNSRMDVNQHDLQLIEVSNKQNKSKVRELNSQNKSQDDASEDDDCFEKCCLRLAGCVTLHHLDEAGFFNILTNSWTRKIRYAIKLILSYCIYIPLFYMAYFNICGNLLVQRSAYNSVTVTTRQNVNDLVPTVNFSVVTMNSSYFSSYYNCTLSTLQTDMNCARNNYYIGPYGDQVYINTYIKQQNFLAFGIIGFLLIILHMIMKGLQICRLDLSRVMTSIKATESNKYSKVLSYVFTEFGLASLFSIHYLLYGSLYHMQLSPCLKNPPLPSVDKLFSGATGSFVLLYIWQYIGLLIIYIYTIYFTSYLKNKDVSNYVWIILLILYIAGVCTRGMGGFVGTQSSYDTLVSLFGVCGELLQILSMFVCGLIDAIFWRAIRRKRKVVMKNRIDLADESHATIQNTEYNVAM